MSKQLSPSAAEGMEATPAQLRRWSRRAFTTWAAAGFAGLAGWGWLRSRSLEGGVLWPLRLTHRFNEVVGRGLFSQDRLATEFPRDQAGEPTVNGEIGRPERGATPAPIRVEQVGHLPRTFSVAEVFADLPRVEMTTEFKCVEGWSRVVNWGGVRFADFVAKLGTGADRHEYVSLETANGNYYVGLDVPSALQPQTLLCDQMNGEPLTYEHGAPLRLVVVVKYGIKNIKWLSRIRFLDERPPDYWGDRGYDWYSGL
jgi:hypothetical protein